MIEFLVDQNFNEHIMDGLTRRDATLGFTHAQFIPGSRARACSAFTVAQHRTGGRIRPMLDEPENFSN